ncbi:MAG: hypothetical protein FWG85_02070 [Bacteroidetes bacterium]|nr:hypothetical protein [Bacteroidota bacterium]
MPKKNKELQEINITENNNQIVKADANVKGEIAKTNGNSLPISDNISNNKKSTKAELKEKQLRKTALKIKQYADILENDKELQIKQRKEEKNIKKGIRNAILLMISIVGLPFGVFKLIKNLKKKQAIKSPFELRKIIIIEEALKKHNDKNRRILEVYKEEKERIKRLKKLPFKILNHVNFLISMFLIILFFFILDVGIAPTALVLFTSFCFCYFLIGVLMHLVFYMVAENKTREKMAKLEEEKNRLLAEEKLKADELLRDKIDKERKRFEEIERLRIQEEKRRIVEEEQLRILKEEEARIKAEEEQKMLELEAEKERIVQSKRNKFMQKVIELPPPPTTAELAQEKEILKNEFDRNLLTEIESKFTIPDISGIEYFSDRDRLQKEYSGDILFKDIDSSEEALNQELDNTMLQAVKKVRHESDDITDFDTTDIEEAKGVIFRKARMQVEKHNTSEEELSEKEEKEMKGKAVSGKSFMILKQMLKDE